MIDTPGPGRVWGAGGTPAGSPDVTLTATNTVVEDNDRSGFDSGGSPVGGQTYYYRLTNPAHDPCECGPGNGPNLAANDGAEHVLLDWASAIYEGRMDGDCPTPGAPEQTGYVTTGFGGVFELAFTANYCNACGPVTIDESFTLDLWGPL